MAKKYKSRRLILFRYGFDPSFLDSNCKCPPATTFVRNVPSLTLLSVQLLLEQRSFHLFRLYLGKKSFIKAVSNWQSIFTLIQLSFKQKFFTSIQLLQQTVCLPDSLDLYPLSIDFVRDKRLWISWFPRLRFCGRCTLRLSKDSFINPAFISNLCARTLRIVSYFNFY